MESPYGVRLSKTGRRGAEGLTPSTTPWSPFLREEGFGPSRTRSPYKVNDVLSDECTGEADDQWSSLRGAVK